MNKYVGSRYVPLYIGTHDDNIEYEPLSIVSNAEKTETYTSKQHVPIGVSLDNDTYWAQSGWSNADLQIEVDNAPVVSTDDSELMVERTKNGYLLTLSDSNSFDCGGDFGEAYTLNTMYDVGRYMINPSICSGVPSQISDIENPAELLIADYTEIGGQIMKQYQKITAFDDDGAASFIRVHDGLNWGDWKMIGGGIGMLPIASASVLGGVKIGDGINVTEDGTISVSGGGSVAAEWVDVSGDISVEGNRANIIHALLNESTGILDITFKTQNYQANLSEVKIVSLTNNTLFQFTNLNGNKWIIPDATSDAKTVDKYCLSIGHYNISPAVFYIPEFSITYNTGFTRVDNNTVNVLTVNSSVSTNNVISDVHMIICLKKA